jgi:DNA-binding LacI/PurR family transcriptional regulator
LIFAVTPYHYGSIQTLLDDKLPFVLVNSYQENTSSVYARPVPGMEKAFLHAASLGHESIGYITGDLTYLNGKDRLLAFETLAAKFRIKTEIVEGNFSRRSGYESFSKFSRKLGNEITLVMTASDREAIGLVEACREHKVSVPEDLSVIGFDNFSSSNTVPQLTTVNHPITNMGTEAARLLIRMINSKEYNPEQIWIDTDFVIRNSTAKRRK